MSTTISIRRALSQDMAVCAGILNDWIDETEWMPRIHTREHVEKHYRTEVAARRQTYVAFDGTRARGFTVLSADGFVTALYVEQASRSLGIGTLLLERAKRELDPMVRLYTFQANIEAQEFYRRQGFVEINRTSGDNEENLPDILLEWHA